MIPLLISGKAAAHTVFHSLLILRLPPAAELQPKETLLHLAVRLGLVHLSRFLIHQPRGQRALTLPNQEGDTPLQLAQKDGQHAMFRVLAA